MGTWSERIEARLRELRAEFQRGQQMLADVEAGQRSIRDSMLRIAGAVQVLEEELQEASSAPLT